MVRRRLIVANETHVYKIQGLSCTNCAAKFEKNVKNIKEVTEVDVNFQAAKITVVGDITKQQLEKAGAFDNLRFYKEGEEKVRIPWWKSVPTIRTAISGILLVAAFTIIVHMGAQTPTTNALFLTSMVVGGYALFWQGLKNLFSLTFDMKTLMTIAVLGAVAIGELPEGAVVVFLFAISEALETFAMDRARRSIESLVDMSPKTAKIKKGEKLEKVPVDAIQIGDVMVVRPGEKIAMDGMVRLGQSSVNQAAITGESMPVVKTAGETVYAGTLNEEGMLEIEVTKTHEDTTLAKMIHLVEEAQAERAPSQAFIDKFASVYTPIIIAIAIGVAIVPPLFFGGEWMTWIYQGLAVLVVGCPCALVISTPVSIVTAIGSAAKQGVLIKGGVHLEEAGHLEVIAFDKTGTLTKGKPEVTNIVTTANITEEEVCQIAAALEQHSQHPLAQAIVQLHRGTMDEVEQFHSDTGKGVRGIVRDVAYRIGSPSYIEEFVTITNTIQAEIDRLREEAKTVVVLANETEIVGLFTLADQMRKESPTLLQQLKKVGIRETVLLTGDHEKTANAIAKQVGVDSVLSNLLPDGKLSYMKDTMAKGKRIAMVGDGVNDAPALATANVGIAMGGAGTDVALETADVVLMKDDLSKLPFTIKLSKKALRIIKQNITLSLVLKIVALLLVIPGWLTLWIAIIADMGATLLVTLNGLRLLKVKK
nr:heavy metal translocating P-type ATPase [Alkalihalobacterium bogoriense]